MKCPGASEGCVKPEDGLQHAMFDDIIATKMEVIHIGHQFLVQAIEM